MADGSKAASPATSDFFFLAATVGAWVWFWQQADDGFWWHVLAVLKGLVWPAFLVYEGFDALDPARPD